MASITTNAPKANDGEGRGITLEFNYGENLEEMTGLFAEQAIYNAAKGQFRVAFQAMVRAALENGKTDEEIEAAASGWEPPTEGRTKQSPLEKAAKMFDKMNPEDQAAFLAKLQTKA